MSDQLASAVRDIVMLNVRNARAEEITDVIGGTALVKLNYLAGKASADVYAKMESNNPGGSVKDRICLAMIEDAEKRGVLKPGETVIEPTSGNTGIGLALVCAVKKYRLILTMPESMSLERRSLLRAYGAELMLTPREQGMQGAIELAGELRDKHGYFMPMQFDNPANPDAHRRTTGPELLAQMEGKSIDAFVAGVGTGGTISGVGQALREAGCDTRLIAVEPARSPVLSEGRAGPHGIQGIGAGFVPKNLDRELIDEIIQVDDDDAMVMKKRLALEEGLLVGISAGANVWAALRVAATLGAGKNVVTVLCDTGERYLSMDK
jgi:cysteine synthase